VSLSTARHPPRDVEARRNRSGQHGPRGEWAREGGGGILAAESVPRQRNRMSVLPGEQYRENADVARGEVRTDNQRTAGSRQPAPCGRRMDAAGQRPPDDNVSSHALSSSKTNSTTAFIDH
jgi:hypothetical protein